MPVMMSVRVWQLKMSKDETMQALKHQIIKGWPPTRTECSGNLQEFWNYRDEVSVLDGLVLKGSHIVIPESCRDEILNQLHEGHFGIDRTKLCTRESCKNLQFVPRTLMQK